jgi:hypothetical protein
MADPIKPVPAEPRSPDEAGEAMPGAQDDRRVVEERHHASDASGLPVDDNARGEKRKQQYRDGMSEVSEMD